MTLWTDMLADLAAVLDTDEAGEEIAYTPAGGEETTIAALFDDGPGELTVRLDEDSAHDAREATVLIRTDDENGITEPGRGDTFTRGGEQWGVMEITGLRAGVYAVLRCRRQVGGRKIEAEDVRIGED